MTDEHTQFRGATERPDRPHSGIVVLDSELTCRYVDSTAERILGVVAEELVGESVRDLLAGATDTGVRERIERAVRTGGPVTVESDNGRGEGWADVRIYPSTDCVTLSFTETGGAETAAWAVDDLVETAPVGIAVLDSEGEIQWVNQRTAELLREDRSEIEGRTYTHPEWEIWDETGGEISTAAHPITRVLATGETITGFTHGITLPDGSTKWLSSNVAPVVGEDGTVGQVVVALEDVTGLKRLEQLTETLQPVHQLLGDAAPRAETEQGICELLTETREYDVAAIGECTAGPTLLEPHVTGGRAAAIEVLEETGFPLLTGEAAETAVGTREVTVVEDVRAVPGFDPAHGNRCDGEFGSAIVVPLTRSERVYGVLGLYTRRVGAFDSLEQTLLQTLGGQIGKVVHAIETEQLLHSSAVVELTFRSTDTDSFLVSASGALGCSLDVKSTVPTSDGALVHHIAVDGASVSALTAAVAERDSVVETRPIRDREKGPGGVLEVISRGESLAQALVSLGAVVTADTVVDGKAKVVCEIPLARDVTALVDGLLESFPETELAAKREVGRSRDRATRTSEQVLADVFDAELSDRQRQVLRTAVYGGYFRSPRRSSASDIADALSLSQSTVSYHLRNAQDTLFRRMFEQL